MSKLIGTNPNQVPSNADLGTAAFMDKKELLLSKGSSLSAIDAIIPDTTVDLFVYDTSKDSDGGAWRKRTQHTSWYNEKLNTTTRGKRKEFPTVAVIIIKNNLVTIYDGDDSNMPMWMVFEGSAPSWAGGHIIWSDNQAVVALNATIVVPDDEYGVTVINFLKDGAHRLHSASNGGDFKNDIEGRNTDSGYAGNNTININNNYTHKAVMKVMPNSRVDSVTGLPVPTIAISSNGGVSVVKDDDSVIDFVGPGSPYVISKTMNFTNDGRLRLGLDGGGQRYYRTYIIGGADRTVNQWDPDADDGLTLYQNYANGDAVMLGSNVSGANEKAIKTSSGITFFDENLSIANHSLVAHTNSSYSTGWMVGDVRLATLSDTDDTNVTGGELITNGTFASNTSGWSVNSNGTFTSVSGRGRVTNTQTGDRVRANSGAMTTVVGKHYTLSFETYNSGGFLHLGKTSGGVEYQTNLGLNGSGKYTHTFVATGTEAHIQIGASSTTNGQYAEYDNISLRLAEPDRSVNSNGVQVFGTVTKTPVASGTDLVAYSGFSASNYLQQPYNSDLNFGTATDFSCSVWVNYSSVGNRCIYHRGSGSTGTWGAEIIQLETNSTNLSFNFSPNGFTTSYQVNTPVANLTPGVWKLINTVRRGNTFELWLDGVLMNSLTQAVGLSNTSAKLWIGERPNLSRPMVGSLSLMRWTATAPTPEQIKKIYKDEKVLFQENAKATLYGTSDGVTGFSYDDDTELLHAGTSAGRSVFQGLRRIDNTTDGVTTAISAVNGMVVEE
jgi:hypothetical protein